MTTPVTTVPGEGVAGSWAYLGQALPVVADAARRIDALPVLAAVPGLPDLAAHATAAHDLAAGFLDSTGPAAESVLQATARWAAATAAAVDSLVTSMHDVGDLDGDAADLAGDVAALERLITMGDSIAAYGPTLQSDVTDLDAESAQVGGLLVADTQALQRTLALSMQDQVVLTTQAVLLQQKIDDDHQAELWGWLGGPFGYLAARGIGDLVDDVSGLERRIADLQHKAGADGQAIATLGTVAVPLAALSQGASHLGVGMQALADGWSVLLGLLHNAQTALTTAGTDPPFAMIPDLTAASTALHRLADASTGQGPPS